MKEMKKILAFFLCFVMVLGFVPVQVFAAVVTEKDDFVTVDKTQYMMFATDRHGSTSAIGEVLAVIEDKIGDNALEYVGLGGDMVSGQSSYKTSAILDEVQAVASNLTAADVDVTKGSHDGGVDDDLGMFHAASGFLYEGEDYYVYGVIQSDMESSSSAAADAFVAWATGADIDTSKVIIVLSHLPLHKFRNDNLGATHWSDALNEVATGSVDGTNVIRDVIFFHGHNHSQDGGQNYFYGVGDTMTLQGTAKSASASDTVYYTYATAGYLNDNGQASVVAVNDSSISLTRYDSEGSADVLATVARAVATPVYPTQLIVTGENEYTVGGTFAAPEVSVAYSDGTNSGALAADKYTVKYTLNDEEVSGVDTSVAGVYTLDYTCNVTVGSKNYAATAQFTVTVKEAETEPTEAPTTEPTDPVAPTVTGITVTAPAKTEYELDETLDTTGMVVTATYSDNTTATITEGYTVSAVDMTTAGEKTVTVTYEGCTATFTVTVKEAETSEPNTVSCEAGYMDDDGVTFVPNGDVVSATGEGLESITAMWNDTVAESDAVADAFGVGAYNVYDVTIEGYTQGETITITMDLLYFESEGLELYYVNADGELERITPKSAVTNVDPDDETFYWTTVTFTTDRVGTFVVGTPVAADIPAEAVLSRLEITQLPDVTKYFIDEDATEEGVLYLDITGLEVNAIYTYEGVEYEKPLEWDQFKPAEIDGYALTMDSMTTKGVKTVTVSYGDLDPVTFTVTVYQEHFEDEITGVTVQIQDFYETELAVTPNSDAEIVKSAMAELEVTNYVSYDIDLTGHTAGQQVIVTLPIPEGIETPAVYYVSDDGTYVQKLLFETNSNGTVSFVTDHFSIYLVGEEAANEADREDEVIEGTQETKTVYVLVESITEADNYLIVDSNSATTSANMLTAANSGVTNTSGVTVSSGTDSGGNTVIYIESPSSYAIWAASANNSGWTLNNSSRSRYLRYDNGLTTTNKSNSATTWYSDTNQLYRQGQSNDYWIRYSSGWGVGSANSEQTVYIYKEETVTFDSTQTYSVSEDDVLYYYTGTSNEHSVTLTPELLCNGTAVTLDGTWSYAVVSDNAGIIDMTNSNNTTGKLVFTGNEGTAKVRIYYTLGEYKAWNTITVTAKYPAYTVTILKSDGTTDIGETHTVKGATNGATYDLQYRVNYDLSDEPISDATVQWAFADENGDYKDADGNLVTSNSYATINSDGTLTFTGVDGEFDVVVIYKDSNGNTKVDYVTIKCRQSLYTTKDESTKDFPVWGEDGSVTYNKTATAVGNFSETGTALVELSVAAIPSGGPVDVYLMIDLSNSIRTAGLEDEALAAAAAFAGAITDECTNDSRVAVGWFNASATTTITFAESEDMEWEDMESTITGITTTTSGTNYTAALSAAKAALDAEREDGVYNPQYLVFISDGAPTSYTYVENDNEAWSQNNQPSEDDIEHLVDTTETYSNQMKSYDDPVTIYTISLNLSTTSDPNALNIIKGIATDENKYANIASGQTQAQIKTQLTTILEQFASEMKPAAKGVEVEDAMGDAFNLALSFPNVKDLNGDAVSTYFPEDFQYYIELVSYDLDSTTYARGTETVVQRLNFATNANGEVYISSIVEGTTTKTDTTPTFKAAATDEEGNVTETAYYKWTDSDSDGVADAGEYSYAADGKGNAHMTSGAYFATYDDGTKWLHTMNFSYDMTNEKFYWTLYSTGTTGVKEFALRYFVYLENSLEYLYDKDEQGNPNASTALESKSYQTNEYAYLTYTNFNDVLCRSEFPVPSATWNGARVSYVFYLVNEYGKPVNRAGREVSFEDAVFVTDIYTQEVIWNQENILLTEDFSAANLLPDAYTLYDPNATYNIYVHKYAGVDGDDEDNLADEFNYFIVTGSDQSTLNTAHGVTGASVDTTKVYNIKTNPKTIAPITTGGSYREYDTNQIYSAYASENSVSLILNSKTIETTYMASSSFDYSNTTVAFAVLWEPKLVEDVIVVDFGLPVEIDVVSNDFVYNYITGIGTTAPAVNMNTGTYSVDDATISAQEIEVMDSNNTYVLGHAKIEDDNHILFTPGAGDSMIFNEPAVFFYETDTQFWEDGEIDTVSMYSKVTVIPATTVYYEDSFVDLGYQIQNEDKTWPKQVTDGGWTTDGTTVNATQEQDRPGESLISDALDADNNYGYDSAYTEMSKYSLGSAAKINVTTGRRGVATFEFYGTGFDIISLTSNTTGTITVKVVGPSNKNLVVDTYYGYSYGYCQIDYVYTETGWQISQVTTEGLDEKEPSGDEWPANPAVGATHTVIGENWYPDVNNPNALYQVPVIKLSGLSYGKYTVTITAAYSAIFDHDQACTCGVTGCTGCYEFILDAIRIYDPTGVTSGSVNNETVSDAYEKDGEGWPVYEELRNNIIEAGTFVSNDDSFVVFTEVEIDAFEEDVTYYTKSEDGTYTEVDGEFVAETTYYIKGTSVNGIVFIDSNDATTSIDDYVSYGPNNELYLAKDQAIAFNVTTTDIVADVQLGIKVANGDEVAYEINGDSYTVKTATDMYYSILEYAKAGTVVIENTSGGILSLTNIKVTYSEDPGATPSAANLLWMDGETAGIALMSLRRMPVVEEPTEPETKPTEPETEPTEPETEPTEPETKPTEPETKPTEPETEPTEPETEPTEPETKPTEPETEPTEPETKPTEPETKPTEPETEPTEPETEPTEPETKPTEPETEPTEPETEPSEPETEPTEPEVPAEPESFEPGKLNVYLSSSSVKVGKSVIVTVTTSADVQSLSVNGEAVTRYVYSRWTGTKTWVVTVDAESVGEMAIDVVAYNAAGLASETVTNTVTVTGNSGSFLDKLFGWLFG